MFASKTIAITFILVVSSLCVFAQTPPPAPETPGPPSTGSITGRAVDENGQPLKDVTVQIGEARSNESKTISTDRDGRFQVNALASMEYHISAWKPAYLFESAKGQRAGNSYRLGDRVTLTFSKGGVVTGKVLDVNGDPVVTINVSVQMVRDSYGRALPNGYVTETRLTDDRGIYRVYGLRAGTYIVSAGGPGRSSPLSSKSVYQFDVATYAPSATRETAAEIGVRLGEEIANVDIRYRGEQGRLISGDVTVPASSHSGLAVMVTTGGRTEQAEGFYQADNKRSFVFKGAADGEYSVIAYSYSPEEEMALSESRQVIVQGKDVTGIHLTTKLLGSVSGRVVVEPTNLAECTDKEHPLTTETSVFAWPMDDEAAKQIPQYSRARNEPARPDEKGDFLLRNLASGAYYFGPSLKARQWYVQSITFGAPTNTTTKATANAATKARQLDATRVWTNVKMAERLSGLTITLAQGGASLRGEFVVAPGEQAPAGSFLYLVPVEREKANDVLRFFATPIASNGYFELNNIAPGRYWVLAQTAGDSGASKVRLPHETETRAQLRREAEAAKTEIEFKPCQNVVNYKLSSKPASQ